MTYEKLSPGNPFLKFSGILRMLFFTKQFIDLSKTGHKKNTTTYHYILLKMLVLKVIEEFYECYCLRSLFFNCELNLHQIRQHISDFEHLSKNHLLCGCFAFQTMFS